MVLRTRDFQFKFYLNHTVGYAESYRKETTATLAEFWKPEGQARGWEHRVWCPPSPLLAIRDALPTYQALPHVLAQASEASTLSTLEKN